MLFFSDEDHDDLDKDDEKMMKTMKNDKDVVLLSNFLAILCP